VTTDFAFERMLEGHEWMSTENARFVNNRGQRAVQRVFFAFGLLLWARLPEPKYVLLLPLAWALGAAPGNIAMGHAADFPLILFGMITARVLIWRDRTSSWQTVAAEVLLSVMIARSGHDDWLIGIALVLVAVTLAQTIWSNAQRLREPATAARAEAFAIGESVLPLGRRTAPVAGGRRCTRRLRTKRVWQQL